MQKFSKIYIAGHQGLIGLVIALFHQSCRYSNLIVRMLKELDVSQITGLGWKAKTALRGGIALAHKDFLEKFDIGIIK